MNPSETQIQTTPEIQTTTEIASQIKVHKSQARFVGTMIIFIFLLLIATTILVLWNIQTKEKGAPNIQKETEQLIDEVKKEINQTI